MGQARLDLSGPARCASLSFYHPQLIFGVLFIQFFLCRVIMESLGEYFELGIVSESLLPNVARPDFPSFVQCHVVGGLVEILNQTESTRIIISSERVPVHSHEWTDSTFGLSSSIYSCNRTNRRRNSGFKQNIRQARELCAGKAQDDVSIFGCWISLGYSQ